MSGFIPEITTRVTVKVNTDELDNAINVASSSPILSELGFAEMLEEQKETLMGLKEPLAEAVAERLSENQENIISRKHFKSGMMAESVDVSAVGDDYLVGNTATSVDGFPYPLAIEKGTSPHWVEPVTSSALHWFDKDGEHFSKGHMVGGITPDPFVEPSIRNTIWDIDEIYESL